MTVTISSPASGFDRLSMISAIPTRGGNQPSPRVLFVAYPLATVSDSSCGGAEQMLFVLDRELTSRAYDTVVAACSGSRVTGQLLETGAPATSLEQLSQRDAKHHRVVADAILASRADSPFNVIHDQGGRFWIGASNIQGAILATLHLPRSFYPDRWFNRIPDNVFFNCVSKFQATRFADIGRVLGVVPNGITINLFPYKVKKDNYLVWLGRICEGKAPHIAMDVAESANFPLVLMGPSYLFPNDKDYFDRELLPRFNRNSEFYFVGSPAFEEKVDILCRARALLMTSVFEEASSVVCLEAMACGTPAIAFNNGALPEIVVHGTTGFIAQSTDEMVNATACLSEIDPRACRRHVEAHHDVRLMADNYAALYDTVISAVARQRHQRIDRYLIA